MPVQFVHERRGMVMEVIAPDDNVFTEKGLSTDAVDTRNRYQGPSPWHVNYCGYEHCYPGYAYGPHARTSYLLHIVADGKGVYHAGDQTYHIEKGQLFLIYPSVVTTYKADDADPWSYYWVGFSGYQSEYILSQMGFSRDHLVISVEDLPALLGCINRMMDTNQVTLSNELYRTSELLRFFSCIISSRSPNDVPSGRNARTMYANLAMKYLSSNFSRKLSITDLAAHIGVDRSYLSKSFRAEFGMSPQEYMIRLRMRKAAHLLEQSEESVTAVVEKCGYLDALAFSKVFRKAWGCSPTAYRQKNINPACAERPDC